MLILLRYNLNSTFDVAVGSELYTLHTTVFTERSAFFRAARKSEWLAGDLKKPVDLKDEDPEVFNTYTNCVYFGAEALKCYSDGIEFCSHSERGTKSTGVFNALIRVYLLADKLQDPSAANMVIDEIIRFSDVADVVPDSHFWDVYSRTPRNSPLRILMRDYWMYEMNAMDANPLGGVPKELMEDILLEFLRIKSSEDSATIADTFKRKLSEDTVKDKCRYHQHDDKHPRCVPEPNLD